MSENYITVPGEQGSIFIAEDVLAVIAAAAIQESEGVAGLTVEAGSAQRKGPARGVSVSVEDGVVRVDAVIMARYGESIAAIGERAQKAAVEAVESMTGLKCLVNLRVAGVSFEK